MFPSKSRRIERVGANHRRRGITLPDLLAVVGVIGLLVALIAPAVQQARERARATQCRSNLKQLALAAHAHEAAYQSFPYTSTAWINPQQRPISTQAAVAPHRHLMVFLDATIFERIDFEDPATPAWNQAPPSYFAAASNREIQRVVVPILSCPSDGLLAGATNYRANIGISSRILPPSSTIEAIAQRGAFVNGRAVFPFEFADGLSQTALFSERVVGDHEPSDYDPFRDFFGVGPVESETEAQTERLVVLCRDTASWTPSDEYSFAGGSWLFGGLLHTWYTHVLPPNSPTPDCGFGSGFVDGGPMVVTARSFHDGGVHVAMGDGSVRFVSNSIDVNVWKAAGTRNGREASTLE